MAGPATAANNIARTKLYLGSAEQGVVFGRTLNFYSGAPTTPVSFTGNQILGVNSDGPGANIINGIGPGILISACDEPVLIVTAIIAGDDNLFVSVALSNLLPGDVFVLFNTNGNAFSPSQIDIILGGLNLTFPDPDLLPAGSYSLKVIREGNPDCFDIVYNIYNVAGTVCAITTTAMSSPTSFPVFPPGPPGSPGGFFPQIDVVGTGFLTGPLTITLTNSFPPFDIIIPASVTIGDDMNLMFSFFGNGVDGFYSVRVALTAEPTCFDEPPTAIALVFA